MQPSQAPNTLKLPRAVLRRSAAIDARYAPKPADEPEPNPADPNAPAATAPAVPVAPAADPQPPAPAGDPRDSDPDYWRQRFQVTEGILRRERTDRRTENEGLHQQMTELQGQVRALQAQSSPTQKIDIAKYFTPEQIELYGAEQCETMAATAERAASTKAEELISAAVQPLKDAQARTATNDAEAKKQAFISKVTELVPDWQIIDVDPGFLAWLAEEDENTGTQRQELLNIHIRNKNAAACGRMFMNWKATQARTPAPPPAPRVPPVAPSGSGAAPGDTQAAAPAAPDPGAAMGHPSKEEKKAYFTRSALGKVKDAERTAFEARLALPRS